MSSRKKIQWMAHLAHRSDDAPSDFFLFGHIKRKLTEYDIPDQQSLTNPITHIFHEIGQETFIAIFEIWINRLERVIQHEGEYLYQ
jgi:hypothetical protein